MANRAGAACRSSRWPTLQAAHLLGHHLLERVWQGRAGMKERYARQADPRLWGSDLVLILYPSADALCPATIGSQYRYNIAFSSRTMDWWCSSSSRRTKGSNARNNRYETT